MGEEEKEGLKTEEEITNMSFEELQKEAASKGIDIYNQTKDDLLALVYGITTGTGKYVYNPPVSPEVVAELKEGNKMVPKPVTMWAKDKAKWMKIIEKDSLAFTGRDLTDPDYPVQHVLDRHVKCPCGAEFDIPETKYGNPVTQMMCPGVKKVQVFKNHEYEVRVCIDDVTKRRYIFHDVPED
jgi:hypothetical protein